MTPRPILPSPARRFALVIALAAILALAWLGPLDRMSHDYVDKGLQRAMVTFAAARTANAVISVVQSTTLSGVVVSASPGQALDPLNDVVEDFSNLMLAACVSLGAQKLLISIGALHAISALLTLALLGWIAFSIRGQAPPPWLTRALVLLLFVRFAVPIAAVGSESAFRFAMSGQYQEAQSQVELALQPPAATAAATDPNASLFDRFREWLAAKGADLKDKVTAIKARMEEGIRHMVTLMAIFIVQTAVLPLLFLWLSYRLFGASLRWPGILAARRE
jgi:hypothetical protein